MERVPERPSLDGLEARWGARWEADGTYRFDRRRPREDVYAIDFPPLTVSGSLHVGHVFSYCHTDVLARFQRMRGRAVFYPVGWDDNGLPTERRVENYYGVRCDPSLPYDPGFSPPASPAKRKLPISRPNFVELCRRLTDADEQVFETLWRQLGLSVDWSLAYATIGERARRASQRGFLRLLAGGEAYQAEAPTLWDVTYRTAVAQAEVEDREVPGVAVRLRFGSRGARAGRARPGGGDDPAGAAGGLRGPGRPPGRRPLPRPGRHDRDHAAVRGARPGGRPPAGRPRQGDRAGHDLHLRRPHRRALVAGAEAAGALGRHPRRPPPAAEPPDGVPAGPAWAELAGQTTAEARRRVVDLLRAAGDLAGEPRPVTHPVKFYENGDRPLEIVTSRQWFIRLLAHRERLLERGRELEWQPPFMRARYEHWVTGLHSDWLVSRQRFFGVPIPLWYPLTEAGEVDHHHPIVPAEARLPVDPSTDVPDGYQAADRGRPGGFAGRPRRVRHLGHLLAHPPDRRRLGGGPGAVRPGVPHAPAPPGPRDHPDLAVLHGRPVRLRARRAALAAGGHLRLGGRPRPAQDVQVQGERRHPDRDAGALRGRRPALLGGQGPAGHRHRRRRGPDAGRPPPGHQAAQLGAVHPRAARRRPGGAAPAEALDLAMLAGLDAAVADATAALEAADWTAALERVERFFWSFCDDYLELVKDRAYRPAGEPAGERGQGQPCAPPSTSSSGCSPPTSRTPARRSGRGGATARSTWRPGRSPDPAAAGADRRPLEAASQVIAAVRRAKSQARLPLRTPVALAVVTGPRGVAGRGPGRRGRPGRGRAGGRLRVP